MFDVTSDCLTLNCPQKGIVGVVRLPQRRIAAGVVSGKILPMFSDCLNAELLCCLRRNITHVLRLPQRQIAVLSPEKYYQCSQTASTPNCCVVSGKIRPMFSDCALMYKIERQLEFPAGMNKVYCYCCYLLPIFVTAHWAVQAGLLTPLTFARDLLSFLVAFTSGAYFLHSGRW